MIKLLIKLLVVILCRLFEVLWIIIKVLFFAGLFGLYCVVCDKFSQFLSYEMFGNSMGLWHFLIMMFLIFVPIYLYWIYKEKALSNED